MQQVTIEPTFSAWRIKARALLVAGVAPVDTFWNDGQGEHRDLFPEWMGDESANLNAAPEIRIPRAFIELAEIVSCHCDSSKWGLLYRIVWRLTRGEEGHLLDLASDSDIQKANGFVKEVQRDCHKMRAFVKFRKVGEDSETGREQFTAWFEPMHDIVRYNAAFFQKRYAEMDWSIETPGESVHWDGIKLRFSDGVERKAELEDLYLRDQGRVEDVALVSEAADAAPVDTAPVVAAGSLKDMEEAVQSCRACTLWEGASQAVFGSGNESAAIMLIGDQPGDEDDRSGQPFVGSVGKLLDDLLEEAGLNREELYITNAVKHFKWKPGGKRRLREKVNADEISACRPWVFREIAKVKPQVIVTIGSAAAQAVIGPCFKVMSQRGLVDHKNEVGFNGAIVATIHPSFLLTIQDAADREKETQQVIGEWRLAASLARKKPERVKVKY